MGGKKKCKLAGANLSHSFVSVSLASQVKKLQVMLRQANDQLERTLSEKQELEDSVKQGNEETTAKVCPDYTHTHTLQSSYAKSVKYSKCKVIFMHSSYVV